MRQSEKGGTEEGGYPKNDVSRLRKEQYAQIPTGNPLSIVKQREEII